MKGKKYLFTVLAVALLMVGLSSISYAFFSYIKEGTTTNQMKTGVISVNMTDGTALNVTNLEPVTTAVGSGDSNKFTFTLTQTNTTSSPLNFYIYAVPGADVAGKTRLTGEPFRFQLSKPSAITTFVSNYTTAARFTAFDNSGPLLVGYGKLPSGVSSATNYEFTGHLWMDDSDIHVSDTVLRNSSTKIANTGATASAACDDDATRTCYPAISDLSGMYVFRTSEFNNHFFNLKIVVEVFDSASDTYTAAAHATPIYYR